MLRCIILSVWIASVLASPSLRFDKKVLPSSKNGRIFNGEPAKEGQFPWQVGLHIDTSDYSTFCGGTIISADWILTAGHCVNGAQNARVIYGTLDSDANQTSISAAEFILHENFDPNNLASDVGLIKLEKPLEFSDNIKALSLSDEDLMENTTITVSGWGATRDGLSDISPTLNFVQLVTINKNTCDRWYNGIQDGQICAWSENNDVKSSCGGDSGGPVMINLESDPVHVALVSFVSTSGCESGAPSGYTKTGPFRKWIKEKTGV